MKTLTQFLSESVSKYKRVWATHTGQSTTGVYGETHDGKVKKIKGGFGRFEHANAEAKRIALKHDATHSDPTTINK